MAVRDYRGVTWHKARGAWRVKVKYQQLDYYLGYYDDPAIAARVYDVAARLLFGPDAILNFDGSPPAGISELQIRLLLAKRGAKWLAKLR